MAYLRSVAASKRSGVGGRRRDRGKAVFDGKGACASCHRVDGVGSRVGPDLSGIGLLRRAGELELALLDPDADVQPKNRTYRVVAKDGTATTGRLLSIDSFTVQMLDYEGAAALVRQGGPARPWLRAVADAVVQGAAERAGDRRRCRLSRDAQGQDDPMTPRVHSLLVVLAARLAAGAGDLRSHPARRRRNRRTG